MTTELSAYRTALVNKILFAKSQPEVKQLCSDAVQQLENRQLEGPIVARFLEDTRTELSAFNPMKQDAQQWNNITTAKVICGRLAQPYSFSNE